jgi:uncharacterized membrane protein SpoIIM required for sporulation
LLVAGIYVASFVAGYLMVHVGVPFAVEFSSEVAEAAPASSILSPILSALATGNVAAAVVFTFLVNLSLGAFASTTLPGVIPLLGGLGSIAVTVFRGFTIGALYYYVFGVSFWYAVVAVGTAVLELGAYVFSAAAGIHLSLSAVFPKRQGLDSRRAAFKQAWKDAAYVYVIVVLLLALGAIWEMVGIYLFAANMGVLG